MFGSWIKKFRVAFAGLFWAVGDQNSFLVHIVVSMLVVACGTFLGLDLWQWVTLWIAMGGVWTAELFNTSIELLVQVLHPQYDERIGRVLDIAAAGVLVAALVAIGIGVLVLGPEIYERIAA